MLPGPTPSLGPRTEPCASLGPRQAGYDATPQWALPTRTWPTGPQRSAGDLRLVRFRPRHQQHRRLPSLHQRAAERSLWMAAPDESKRLEVAPGRVGAPLSRVFALSNRDYGRACVRPGRIFMQRCARRQRPHLPQTGLFLA